MAAPPLETGAVKLAEACALPAVAAPIVGIPGTVAGVIELEAAEAAPVPTLFVAVTVKVYAVPFVKPTTTIGDVVSAPVKPPGEEVTV
jgi:hypothetical protein